jgi:hypothetical protein
MNRILSWSAVTVTFAAAGYLLIRRLTSSREAKDAQVAWGSDNHSMRDLDERVDNAMDDSFPASDPPAHRNFTSSGGPIAPANREGKRDILHLRSITPGE